MRPQISTILCCLLIVCTAGLVSQACTSFCLDTINGPIFAINLDLEIGDGHVFINRHGITKEGYWASTTGEVARWTAKYGSVSFNLVGRELPWSGMNEVGLVAGTMQLNVSLCPAPDERPPLSEGYLVQYILDTCSNVQEVIDAVSGLRLAQSECSSHYLVMDRAGDCVAFEFLAGKFVYYSGDKLPVKAMANAPYAAGVEYIQNGTIPLDNPGRSVERVADAAKKIEEFNSAGNISAIDYSFGVLTETVVAPKKWWSNLFKEPYTRWHVVYDTTKREVYFQTVDNSDVRHIKLDSFDLSCDAPLLMLDINEELSGNIDRFFRPYDHDVNLETLSTFCDLWGIKVSDEGVAELVGLFESFKCAEE